MERRLRIVGIATVAVMCGCVNNPPYSRETAFPGSGLGKVERRTEHGGADPTAKPQTVTVPVLMGKTYVPITVGVTPASPRRFLYEIRASDGVLHIVSDGLDFPLGACLAWSGYADGPSRTHWSMGRVQVAPSDKCE
jgi:hypothetical protein